jgi:hypothetical protein
LLLHAALLGGSLAVGRFDFIEDVRGEVGGVMVVDDRRRAGVSELLGDAGSEAARTAGDESNAPSRASRTSHGVRWCEPSFP